MPDFINAASSMTVLLLKNIMETVKMEIKIKEAKTIWAISE